MGYTDVLLDMTLDTYSSTLQLYGFFAFSSFFPFCFLIHGARGRSRFFVSVCCV